ncbi:MAG: FtsX-like permease family protein [Spirochaetia bacterium]|jgi:lipoprotein-releasing system permease protein|nr:FtsX-like permease family protein [Spirochaetia bacterium]
MKSSLLVVGRYLAGAGKGGSLRRIRGAVLSVALSLIPLIVVMEVSDGMIQGITARYLELGTYHLQAIAGRDAQEADGEILSRMRHLPGVDLAVRERQGVALAYSKQGRGGVTLRAVPPELWDSDPGLRAYMEIRSGAFDLSTEDSAVVAAEIASRLRVQVGDEIKILTTRSLAGDSLMPRVSTFTVRGIVSTGYQEMDKLWIYIPIGRGDRIMSRETSRQLIGIKVQKPFEPLEAISRGLRGVLPQGFRIFTWNDLEYAQYVSFRTTRYLLIFIMALIICVAAVNIFSSLVMIQIEKREEIAILKSLGMSGGEISAIFIILGFLVGCVGAFLGVAAGLALSVSINEVIAGVETLINGAWGFVRGLFLLPNAEEHIRIFNPDFYLEHIPVTIKLEELALAAGFSLLVALFAAWLPSRNAGKIRPLEVMRKH